MNTEPTEHRDAWRIAAWAMYRRAEFYANDGQQAIATRIREGGDSLMAWADGTHSPVGPARGYLRAHGLSSPLLPTIPPGPSTQTCVGAPGGCWRREDGTMGHGPDCPVPTRRPRTPPAPTEPAREPVAGDRVRCLGVSGETIATGTYVNRWRAASGGVLHLVDAADGERQSFSRVEPIPADPERAEGGTEWPHRACGATHPLWAPDGNVYPCPTPATPPTPTDVVDEPGIGAVVADCDDTEWTRCEDGMWVPGPTSGLRGVATFKSVRDLYAPLTLVTPATPPAATVGEGDVERLTRLACGKAVPEWDDTCRRNPGHDADCSPEPDPATRVSEGDVEALARVCCNADTADHGMDYDEDDTAEAVRDAYRNIARAVLAAGPWPRSTNAGEGQA